MAATSSQLVAQVAFTQLGTAHSSQMVALVAYAPPLTRATRVSQLLALAAYTSGINALPRSSQYVAMVAYRTGSIENLTSRAWTFNLDGHTFYVITLGEEGTFVYDMTTKQWSQWATQGLETWNMEIGIEWQGSIIAADQANPIIWKLDPNSFVDDDFKAQTRKVSGALALRSRTFVPNYAVRLTGSMGEVGLPDTEPAIVPTVELEFSDDQGRTFTSAGELTVSEDNFLQVLQWLSLGVMRGPQRIFRITDVGALARIDGAHAEVGDE